MIFLKKQFGIKNTKYKKQRMLKALVHSYISRKKKLKKKNISNFDIFFPTRLLNFVMLNR